MRPLPPGLAGFVAAQQQAQQQDSSDLQQAQGTMGLMAALEKRKKQAALESILASSGGDPEKAAAAALSSGHIEAAQALAPLAKMQHERRQAEETKSGLTTLMTPQGGDPTGAPSRIDALKKMSVLYANNPVVMQRIQAEIDKLETNAAKAPQKRERIQGETLVQEEWDGKQWVKVGEGPRFARQVSPVTPPNVAGEQGAKPPSGYRWVAGKAGELEPIPGGPATRTAPEKALPSTAAQRLFENQQNLRRAEMALNLIEGKDVGEMKGDKDATGWKGFLPDAWLQRMDPKGTDARAAIADLGSLVIHERSGAAVTAAEFPRLQPFIPKINDDPETVKKKLKRFAQVYRDVASETTNFYRESGYKVPELHTGAAEPSAPAAPAPAAGGFVEGKLYTDAKGNKARYVGGKFVPEK